MGTINIHSTAHGIAGELSNLRMRPFSFRGFRCLSIESLLQSFKFQGMDRQAKVCEMAPFPAKEYGRLYGKGWRRRGMLWWAEQPMARESEEYQDILRDVYRTAAQADPRFADALVQSRPHTLTHAIGRSDIYETILTEREFVTILTELREELAR